MAISKDNQDRKKVWKSGWASSNPRVFKWKGFPAIPRNSYQNLEDQLPPCTPDSKGPGHIGMTTNVSDASWNLSRLGTLEYIWYWWAPNMISFSEGVHNNFDRANWAKEQQTSWVIAPWWLSVSPWRIFITLFWPRNSLKLTAPSSRSEPHLHFHR